MENVATSVRIPGDAVEILAKLANKLGQPKAQVIQRALQELEERVFWSEVQGAFALDALHRSESTQASVDAKAWQKASELDLKDEAW